MDKVLKKLVELSLDSALVKWGPAGWSIIHCIASCTDEKQQISAVDYLEMMPEFLPCVSCGKHFQEYVKSHPPRESDNLKLWAVKFHNHVNELTKKPIFPVILGCTRYISEDEFERSLVRFLLAVCFMLIVTPGTGTPRFSSFLGAILFSYPHIEKVPMIRAKLKSTGLFPHKEELFMNRPTLVRALWGFLSDAFPGKLPASFEETVYNFTTPIQYKEYGIVGSEAVAMKSRFDGRMKTYALEQKKYSDLGKTKQAHREPVSTEPYPVGTNGSTMSTGTAVAIIIIIVLVIVIIIVVIFVVDKKKSKQKNINKRIGSEYAVLNDSMRV